MRPYGRQYRRPRPNSAGHQNCGECMDTRVVKAGGRRFNLDVDDLNDNDNDFNGLDSPLQLQFELDPIDCCLPFSV